MGTVAEPPPPPHPSEGEIHRVIGEILRNNNFPMTSQALKRKFMERFPRESEAIFSQNVVAGEEAGGYREFPGRHAYYSVDWAGDEDPVQKVNRMVANAASQIVTRTRRLLRAQEIIDTVKRENPSFEGVAELNSVMLNTQLFTDEVMQRNHIIRVSDRSVIYKADY